PEDLARSYGFVKNLYRVKVATGSRLAGSTIGDAAIGSRYDLDVVQVHRPGGLRGRYLHPRRDLALESGDEMWVEGEAESLARFANEESLRFERAGPQALERILGRGVTLAEVTLSPHSTVFGKTLTELRFRNLFGLNVISVWRRGVAVTAGIAELELELGDALLISGPPAKLRRLGQDPDYIVLTDRSREEDVRRAPLAVLILLAAIVPPVLGVMPLAVSALGAALLMVGSGCISLDGARRAVDFRVLFLLIGTIPLGIALEEQGAAKAIALAILSLESALGEPGVLFCLFGLAAVLSMTCNNGAAAVILAPVAAQAAGGAGIDVSKAFLAVAYGASCVFMSPFGSQCNLMVMGPGGYTAKDYLRVGAGLSVVMGVTVVVLLSIL
ncbi:MAG: SLC13 family permease, partial [Planctomycetota bacterium]